jgi:homospermidine synthase
VLTHGANPGLVSHFVKRALLNLARDTGVVQVEPASREDWAALSATLGVKVIHIAERDTQSADVAKRPGEFVNTWSIDGLTGEGCQPAELGWGTHERSRLTIEETRRRAPYNNATSLQVAAAVLGGLVWAIENPQSGIVEADHLDHERVLDVARPYLGDLVGVYSDWTPLVDRGTLFAEDLDRGDPWQFKNFRVV